MFSEWNLSYIFSEESWGAQTVHHIIIITQMNKKGRTGLTSQDWMNEQANPFSLDSKSASLTVLLIRLSSLIWQAFTKNRILNCLKGRPLSSQQSSYNNHFILKHICSICGRTRSSSYQTHHSLTSEQIPYPGICSRCERSAHSTLSERLPQVAAVYEIHHYHHVCCCQTTTSMNKSSVELCGVEILPPQPPSSKKSGISSFISRVYHPYSMPTLVKEQLPPPVNRWSKPTLSIKWAPFNLDYCSYTVKLSIHFKLWLCCLKT